MSESYITKKAIASGLKEIMRKKSFDKITIADVTGACKLNRQTFYYHFQDKIDLLNWIFYHETIATIVEDLNFENWPDKVFHMLKTMAEEKYFYQNALQSSYQNDFRNYLSSVTTELFRNIIDKIKDEKQIDQKDKEFIASFYAYGAVGIIVVWATSGMKESPLEITEHIKHIVYDSKALALARYLKEP